MLEMSVEQEIQTMLKNYAEHKNDIAIYSVLLGGEGLDDKERAEYEEAKEKLIRQNTLVRNLVDALPQREATIIRMHYLDEYGNNKTMKEIGRALSLSASYASELQVKAIKRLQDILNLKGEEA